MPEAARTPGARPLVWIPDVRRRPSGFAPLDAHHHLLEDARRRR